MSCCPCSAVLNQHQKTVIIKNPKSGLVLEATGDYVTIQPFTGCCVQLWTLECIDYGRFIITNKSNGKILNIQCGATSMAKLITYPRTPNFVHENEQWHIHSDGIIMCPAAGQLVVDIQGEKYEAGTSLIAFPRHGKENQIFKFEYQ